MTGSMGIWTGTAIAVRPFERACAGPGKVENYTRECLIKIQEDFQGMRGSHIKVRAPKNRTITLSEGDEKRFGSRLVRLTNPVAAAASLAGTTINQDLFEVLNYLPDRFVDLLFIDPPYNLDKHFGAVAFKEMDAAAYSAWFRSWFSPLLRVLKPTASVYICGDWRTSSVIQPVAAEYLIIQNRITWEREKGRSAGHNWKNCLEDIWFCTVSKDFYFNADAVRLKRRVIAPYKDENGRPRDWAHSHEGAFRLTGASNLWTDLTVPFWSMPENTDHPAQKPEKLLAKIILASSEPGDFVLDPFLGSGTTSVAAKKLGRRFCGIEIDQTFCCLAEKRLAMAELDNSIQGYSDGVFWERNALAGRPTGTRSDSRTAGQLGLALLASED